MAATSVSISPISRCESTNSLVNVTEKGRKSLIIRRSHTLVSFFGISLVKDDASLDGKSFYIFYRKNVMMEIIYKGMIHKETRSFLFDENKRRKNSNIRYSSILPP